MDATSSIHGMTALLDGAGFDVERIETNVLDDRMDAEEFVCQRTRLGLQGWRFEMLPPRSREICLRNVRARVDTLSSQELNARETAILSWARKRGG